MAIKKLKKRKAAGGDGIENEKWLYSKPELKKMNRIINDIWKGGGLPDEQERIIIPIYKRGEKGKVENYRGFTFMDSGYKIYAEILRNRLEKQLEEKEIVRDTQ